MALITILIVSIVVLVILIVLIVKVTQNQEQQSYRSRCQASVASYAKLNGMPFSDAVQDSGNIDCPTEFITIEEDRPDRMRRAVADTMYDCWTNYGRGKLLLFKATDEKFCAICSVIDFEDKKTNLDGFVQFLMSERVPREVSKGVKPTYYEYFSGVDTGTIIKDDAPPPDNSYLDASKRYAVLFTFYKESWWYKARNAIITGAIVTVTVVVAAVLTVITFGSASAVTAPLTILIISAVAGGSGVVGGSAAAAATESADWQAHIIIVEYTPEMIEQLGCESLPVAMLDSKFR